MCLGNSEHLRTRYTLLTEKLHEKTIVKKCTYTFVCYLLNRFHTLWHHISKVGLLIEGLGAGVVPLNVTSA